MKVTVIGAGGNIGRNLVKALAAAGHEVIPATRKELDLLALPEWCPRSLHGEAVYICAAMTRFIECEDHPEAYRINVDATVQIGRWFSKCIYLSSEAVERGLHTNYGMHKALAEMGLRTVCDPTIARLGKVDAASMDSACGFLVSLLDAKPGVHRWRASDRPALAVAA